VFDYQDEKRNTCDEMENKNKTNLGDDVEDFDFIFAQYDEKSSTTATRSAPPSTTSTSSSFTQKYSSQYTPSNNSQLSDYIESVGPLTRPVKNNNNFSNNSLGVNSLPPSTNNNAKNTSYHKNSNVDNQSKAIEYFNAGLEAFEQDDAENCIKYFSLAAKLEEPAAMYNLGLIFQTGALNVTPDIGLAVQWYKLAKQYGNEKAGEILAELEQLYPKYFGLGRVISFFLHLPMNITAAILGVILLVVQYFAIPGLLLYFKGNCYFFKMQSSTTIIISSIWTILALLVICYHLSKDKLFFYHRALSILEGLVNFLGYLFNFLLSLGISALLCTAQYFGVKHYLTNHPGLLPNPYWTKVVLYAPLAFTGVVVFIICICIFSYMKDQINEYY
jgi:tetratricopeptide (TPR) repeat protein